MTLQLTPIDSGWEICFLSNFKFDGVDRSCRCQPRDNPMTGSLVRVCLSATGTPLPSRGDGRQSPIARKRRPYSCIRCWSALLWWVLAWRLRENAPPCPGFGVSLRSIQKKVRNRGSAQLACAQQVIVQRRLIFLDGCTYIHTQIRTNGPDTEETWSLAGLPFLSTARRD